MISRSRNLIQLSLLYFPLNLFWTAMLLQLLPERVEALGNGQKGLDIAVVGSGGALAATLCMFLVGPLSDNTRHSSGRRFPWVVGGVLVGTAGAILFPLAHTLPVLLLAFVLARLGFAAALAAYEAILPDRVPLEFQSRASGWNELFDVMGQFAGLMFTGLMVRGATNGLLKLHLPASDEAELAVFLICIGSSLLFIGVLLLNQKWIRGDVVPKETVLPLQDAFRLAFSWRPSQAPDFAKLYFSRCILNLGVYTGVNFLYYYVNEALVKKRPGLDVSHEVMMISLIVSLGGVFGAVIGGRLGDLMSKRALLYFFCSLSAVAAIGFCITDSITIARTVGFFYGIGFSAINTLDWAFATSLVPQGHEARYLAIFQTCFYLSQVFVMAVGGVIGNHWGYRTLFWTIPVFLLLGMALLSRVRERSEIPEFPTA